MAKFLKRTEEVRHDEGQWLTITLERVRYFSTNTQILNTVITSADSPEYHDASPFGPLRAMVPSVSVSQVDEGVVDAMLLCLGHEQVRGFQALMQDA